MPKVLEGCCRFEKEFFFNLWPDAGLSFSDDPSTLKLNDPIAKMLPWLNVADPGVPWAEG